MKTSEGTYVDRDLIRHRIVWEGPATFSERTVMVTACGRLFVRVVDRDAEADCRKCRRAKP